jgi:hypothetical protein
MRHADGLAHEDVLRWLIEVGRLRQMSRPSGSSSSSIRLAGLRLRLPRASAAAVAPRGTARRSGRFGRLLREQLWPSAIAAELAASPAAEAAAAVCRKARGRTWPYADTVIGALSSWYMKRITSRSPPFQPSGGLVAGRQHRLGLEGLARVAPGRQAVVGPTSDGGIRRRSRVARQLADDLW